MLNRLVPIAAVAALLFPMFAAASGQDDAPQSAASAAEQIDVAKKTRRLSFKKEGDEKARALEATIAEYRKVLDGWPDEKAACAEAAFRIGEIERTLGDAAEARAAFEKAASFAEAAPTFAARATLEIGHLERRAGQLDQALGTYTRVLDAFAKEEAVAVQALTWTGKVQQQKGDVEAAVAAWLSLTERFPADAIGAIRAADLAALAVLEAGDAERARDIVASVRARFENGPLWSPEVEEALGKMKSARRLEEPAG